ncbi:Endonuclease III [wastewater metagenome]|uniref:Endonuclease III n=2 Tax=unclassified sequences TaxID=12908 RepID=A0A5B8R952_9ZZZZ|nr:MULTISPECIES: endonuclease MJ1434 [Arhodomonas]MCS4505023.1 endonuclease [Arhodomonas aquaeolei]QEA05250.1 endonuclease III [uncultured organism]
MLAGLFERLEATYGDLGWWPARDAFEVAVGAVLTQNTAWRNVERAMAGLTEAGLLDPAAMGDAPHETLAEAIRPAGYFNVKTRRLQALCAAWRAAGGAEGLAARETPSLRAYLLDIHGVGRETADDIVLYAFYRPVFVVDAYTYRILGRYGWLDDEPPYEGLRERLETTLAGTPQAYQHYHAYLVELGKEHCRPRPRCAECPVTDLCGKRGVAAGQG